LAQRLWMSGAAVAVVAASCPVAGRTDAPPPPPGPDQMIVVRALSAAGVPCDGVPEVTMLLGAEAALYAPSDFIVFTAKCRDRAYIIEIPPHFLEGTRQDENGRPIPPPLPVVKLLSK
jgi:hypothetical protein